MNNYELVSVNNLVHNNQAQADTNVKSLTHLKNQMYLFYSVNHSIQRISSSSSKQAILYLWRAQIQSLYSLSSLSFLLVTVQSFAENLASASTFCNSK